MARAMPWAASRWLHQTAKSRTCSGRSALLTLPMRTQHGHAVHVSVVPAKSLAPELAAAIQASRASGGGLDPSSIIRDLAVAPGHQGAVRHLALVRGHRVAAAREHDPRDPGAAGCLEDVVGAGDIVMQEICEGRIGAHGGREVNHRLHAREGWSNDLEVGDICLMADDTGYGTPVEPT